MLYIIHFIMVTVITIIFVVVVFIAILRATIVNNQGNKRSHYSDLRHKVGLTCEQWLPYQIRIIWVHSVVY
jgi:hypothetical protein